MSTVIMEFIAKNPPSILFLGAILLYIIGDREVANVLLLAGVFLQVLWLILFRRR